MPRFLLYGALAFLLSGGTLILLGTFAERAKPGQMVDFELVYFASRMVVQHHDPYNVGDFLSAYQQEKDEYRSGRPPMRAFLNGSQFCINTPTALLVIAPISSLTWRYAHVIWMVLTTLGLFIAACLVCDLARDHSKPIAIFLPCFLLANCVILLAGGNISGLAVGLCIISVWCFIRERLVAVGVACLALSLALKPHDSGFILLYFLLAGPITRKRAVYVLSLASIFLIAASLWVSKTAPHWMAEQKANVAAISSRGLISDPGPAVTSGREPHTLIDMRTIASVVTDEPNIYNPVSYILGGLPVLIWVAVTLRSPPSLAQTKLALAAIAAISMLPIYHRLYDAKLLLLTVPACAMLWAEGRLIGWLALVINSAAIFLTGDIPTLVLGILTRNLKTNTDSLSGMVTTIALLRPFPIILLVVGIFYLSVYALRGRSERLCRIER